jgi:hypothetical protein
LGLKFNLEACRPLEVCFFENLRTEPNSKLYIFEPNQTVREEVWE